VKQIVCGCNKMNSDSAGYKQARDEEVSNEKKSMLVKVGWKKDKVEKTGHCSQSPAGWVTIS